MGISKETRKALSLSRNGKIVTYFEPDSGVNYFYVQFDKYGDYWN